jgi:hypothetical protein
MTPDVSLPSTTNPPHSREVRRHLEKLLASSAFSNAPRAQQFLRFVVEETLAGRASDIREPVVAAQVFNLGSSFDRRKSSIVRAEATHVRRRLRDYYTDAGVSDSVIIDLPRGGYVPFVRTAARGGNKPRNARRGQLAAFLSLLRPGKSAPRE